MTTPDEVNLTPAEKAQDPARILRALRQAVREALRRHKREGNRIAVWQDGRVAWIEPEDIVIPDDAEEGGA
jgi:sugar (pentulose or hexulose) kinase